jgi:ElaB/YqjD/DUF883 family membrane-anchored ribosome-binding protein
VKAETVGFSDVSYDEALRRAREVADATDEYVRENPWQSVGIAAGVGLLLGLLLSRR